MKFSISSKELQHALSVVSKVVLKKNTLAILDYAMVSQKDGQFYLTGSSNDNQLTIAFDIRQTEGAAFTPFCIHVTQFLAILGTLPEQPIEINVDEEKNFNTTVIYQGGKFDLPSMSAKEFPEQPDVTNVTTAFSLPADIIVPCVKAAQTCTGADELRPVMGGVALDASVEGVTFVSTDGQKLYKFVHTHGVPFLTEGDPAIILLPRSVVVAFDGAVGKSAEVSVRTDGQRIEITTDNAVLKARSIEGRFPNYNSVIPQDSSFHVTTPVRDLAMAVKRISLMASSSTQMVKLSKVNDVISLDAADIDFGRAATSELKVTDSVLPDGFKIGFKAPELLTLLGNISTDNVRLQFIAANKVILIKEDADNSALTELLMPIVID